MCGRYALDASIDQLEDFFFASSNEAKALPSDWNISPTKEIYLVKNESGDKRIVDTALWGLVPHWASDNLRAANAINARIESISEKPTFREAFKRFHCLIPASGYYEWATELGRYKPKQPFYISYEDKSLMALAGIFDFWVDPATKQTVSSAAIITREAVGVVAPVHHRMPVILPRDRWGAWLSPSNDVVASLAVLDLEKPDANLSVTPVSDAVNNARNSGANLAQAVELGEPETLF
jgi:putative SOS response-associated peptidase YedK